MKRISIVGGTGFIGKFFVERLLQDEFYIVLILRKSSFSKIKNLKEKYSKSLKLIFFDFKKIPKKESFFLFNIQTFIYLIGILFERKDTSFEEAHFIWPKYFSHLCYKFNIPHFIFFSSIGSIPGISRKYIETKLKTETYLKTIHLNYTIIKPPLIYKKYTLFFTLLKKIIYFICSIFSLKILPLYEPVSIYTLYDIVKKRILYPLPKGKIINTKDF